MMKKATIASVLTLFSAITVVSSAQAQNCEYERRYDLELDPAQIGTLEIDAGAGPIEILGQGSGTIQITARACASSERALEGVTLQYERRGDRWEVISDTEVNGGWFSGWTGNRYAYMEMIIVAPNGIALDIDDGSGDLMISEWEGDVEIDDGSGELELTNIVGDIYIDDGSGDIMVTDGAGEIDLEDGSGDIDISQWQGPVFVDDGSGDIEISQVAGNVSVEDGSGGMSIEDIDGDVRIEEDGSGGIDVYRVTGDLTIGSTGSGGLHFNDIEGNVSM